MKRVRLKFSCLSHAWKQALELYVMIAAGELPNVAGTAAKPLPLFSKQNTKSTVGFTAYESALVCGRSVDQLMLGD